MLVSARRHNTALSRTSAEGEGFEPSMDETAHTGFRDQDPIDVGSVAVVGTKRDLTGGRVSAVAGFL